MFLEKIREVEGDVAARFVTTARFLSKVTKMTKCVILYAQPARFVTTW